MFSHLSIFTYMYYSDTHAHARTCKYSFVLCTYMYPCENINVSEFVQDI